jgi:hypothetical protein
VEGRRDTGRDGDSFCIGICFIEIPYRVYYMQPGKASSHSESVPQFHHWLQLLADVAGPINCDHRLAMDLYVLRMRKEMQQIFEMLEPGSAR